MEALPSDLLSKACRIFMDLSYPKGENSVPPRKRPFLYLSTEESLAQLLPPAPTSAGLCQTVKDMAGAPCGYAFRLGSAHFDHLKLRVQWIDSQGMCLWVFMVDTHDAFPAIMPQPAQSDPEAVAWRAIQEQNRNLKEQIECAFDKHDIMTPNSLLRRGLV